MLVDDVGSHFVFFACPSWDSHSSGQKHRGGLRVDWIGIFTDYPTYRIGPLAQ